MVMKQDRNESLDPFPKRWIMMRICQSIGRSTLFFNACALCKLRPYFLLANDFFAVLLVT